MNYVRGVQIVVIGLFLLFMVYIVAPGFARTLIALGIVGALVIAGWKARGTLRSKKVNGGG